MVGLAPRSRGGGYAFVSNSAAPSHRVSLEVRDRRSCQAMMPRHISTSGFALPGALLCQHSRSSLATPLSSLLFRHHSPSFAHFSLWLTLEGRCQRRNASMAACTGGRGACEAHQDRGQRRLWRQVPYMDRRQQHRCHVLSARITTRLWCLNIASAFAGQRVLTLCCECRWAARTFTGPRFVCSTCKANSTGAEQFLWARRRVCEHEHRAHHRANQGKRHRCRRAGAVSGCSHPSETDMGVG